MLKIYKPKKYNNMLREFEKYMAGEKKSCGNKCVFCFIDQLPENNRLRGSLYFKDDDERLSFIHGNYITLTNLEESDIVRIINMRVSPVNISVHTTNPGLRVKLMGNKRAGEVLGYIKRLADAGIAMNAQIVLCKNINDGEELEKTLADLCALYPSMQSVAVVPAGLTKYREENNLPELGQFDKSDCAKIIETADKYGEENLEKYKSRLVYCADEIYLKAEAAIPGAEYYGDYPQYENGVGLMRSFEEEFYRDFEKYAGARIASPRRVSVVTGEAAYGLIKTLADELVKKRENLECMVYAIKNKFFGEEITVAGLVTGQDIIAQLLPHKNNLGDELLIPAVMLRHGRDLFLDDTRIEDIEAALGIKAVTAENGAEDFIKKVLGI